MCAHGRVLRQSSSRMRHVPSEGAPLRRIVPTTASDRVRRGSQSREETRLCRDEKEKGMNSGKRERLRFGTKFISLSLCRPSRIFPSSSIHLLPAREIQDYLKSTRTSLPLFPFPPSRAHREERNLGSGQPRALIAPSLPSAANPPPPVPPRRPFSISWHAPTPTSS